MTGYHVSLGYNSTCVDYENMWEELREAARKVADDPEGIIAEARRLKAPESCGEGCRLEGFADNYAEDFETSGHPISIIESAEGKQIMQLSSGAGCAVKMAVRRAYVRLLLAEMHRKGIEVNLTVC